MNEEVKQKPPGVEVVPTAEGVFEDYGNQLNLLWTLFDVTIRLGHLVPTKHATDGKIVEFVNEETSAITLPWAQAKALRNMLGDAVSRYEKLNGEIRVAEDLKFPW